MRAFHSAGRRTGPYPITAASLVPPQHDSRTPEGYERVYSLRSLENGNADGVWRRHVRGHDHDRGRARGTRKFESVDPSWGRPENSMRHWPLIRSPAIPLNDRRRHFLGWSIDSDPGRER
jgi:hypothetical protein